jgi:hypothetical protein
MERVKRDPDVKKLDELYRPIKLAKFIDATFEATRANPVETTDAAVQNFLDKTSSRRIDRYLSFSTRSTWPCPRPSNGKPR